MWLSGRWVEIRKHHQAAEILQPRPIQVHRDSCRPPGRGLAFDFHCVGCPPKVLIPPLTAWMKQGDGLARGRIEGGRSGSLVTVATLAGKSQVLRSVGPAFTPGQDMLDGVRRWGKPRRHETILATETRPLGYEPTRPGVQALSHRPLGSTPSRASVWERTSCAGRPVR
ncbi:MAG: hypothetical protein QOJ40_944 [Verrucomicrobiota bacterium]